ncbi:MAG: TIGR03960 family B12-binding radical SAM protein, partial [Nitrospinota bacterium]
MERPSRYLGGEVNSVRKDPRGVRIKVALAFPDLYEVGMSHQGIRILYHLLNAEPGVMAERAFTPWTDCADLLEARGYPLSSLESRRPLKDFDILGFSLLYELSFTNVLKMLSLSGIPLKAAERDESWPLVIAGGPCAMNPEPLAPFLDAIALGDGEALFLDILRAHESWREGGGDKDELLDLLEAIPGLYIPSRFRVDYTSHGTVQRVEHIREPGRRVHRRFLEELEEAPYPEREIVPFAEVIHDRLTLEVQRGCTRGCRFCHAGMVYRPVRERSAQRVRDLLLENLRATGYEEVALSSLSLSDWGPLRTFLPELMEELAKTCTSLSLPSLRVGILEPELLSALARVRRSGFTLAPEAGTERLRKVINKGWREEELLEDVRRVLSAGWDKLKLYFMVGLPTEREEDVQAILGLSRRLLSLREGGRRIRTLGLSLSPFV